MDIEIQWDAPLGMYDGSDEGLIYAVDEYDYIPDAPGVYVFARTHGEAAYPIYIGKALSLIDRIGQQLNNVKLMKGIESFPAGYRKCYIGRLITKSGQNVERAIRIAEKALIRAALVESFEILNIQGAKTPVNTIASKGNREACSWLPGKRISIPKGA